MLLTVLGHEDSDWQLNVDLAQSVEHWHEDQRGSAFNLTGGNFLVEFILLFSVHAGRI